MVPIKTVAERLTDFDDLPYLGQDWKMVSNCFPEYGMSLWRETFREELMKVLNERFT
jgi:hypothetical protein